MSTPSALNDSGSLQQYHVGAVLRPAPLMAPSTTCGAVAETFIANPTLQAIVIPLEGGGFGLAARGTYLPEYLQGWNRDLFQRKPITQLMEHDPLVVPEDTPVDQVAMQVSVQRPDVLKSAFIITRGGSYAGIGTGIDLLRAVALRAQQASAAKSTFLAHMSHEIRTPLNAVIGNLELLSETPLGGEQGELASIARVSAQTVIEIIGDLLDLGKIEADRLELEVVDVDLRRVVEEARAIMIPRARAKNLRLLTFVGASVPSIVRTDALRLRQVLINFAGNACKFTSSGGVFLHVTREEERDDKGRVWLRFEVVDTGPGFDPRRAAALFEPYMQEGASTSRLYGGTGLGLAISKRIVELMGGTIGCGTELGSGSTFWCTVPMAVVAESPERALPAPPEVLLVAGSGAMPDNLERWLEQQGARVTRVVDAQAAQMAAGRFSRIVLWREVSSAPAYTPSEDARAAEDGLCREGSQLVVTGNFTATEAAALRYGAYRQGATHVLRYPEQREDLRQALAETEALPSESPAQAPARPPVHVPAGFPPVLIIDDAATNRALAMRQLARLGFASDCAENGLEGFHKASAGNYSLILADDSMPVMDGPTFTRNYRQFERTSGRARVPVIAMTAHALRGDSERLLAAGMDDYLPKPVTLDRLEAMLRTWLSSRIAAGAMGTAGAAGSDAAINLPRLAEMLGLDDPATLADLLSVFVSDLPQLLDQVAQALAARDRAALARAAHAAKGAAASAAAQHLWELLSSLERDAETAAFELLAHQFDLVGAESARVQAQVAGLCSSGGRPT